MPLSKTQLSDLPDPCQHAPFTRKSSSLRTAILTVISASSLLSLVHREPGGLPSFFSSRHCNDNPSILGALPPNVNSSACPQFEALYPAKHVLLDAELESLYATEDFKLKTYKSFSGAIQIPTESYDDNGPVGEDPRWETFQVLHSYFQSTFPLVYENLKVTKVNTYGLVFHWQGSTNAKPILITAHQDVVPVDPTTIDQWEHEPYSGLYDGTWIWGRGSSDDKSDLIEQLITIDSLLSKGFAPARTVVLASGFDEESKGTEGAGHIAGYLETTYGRDGFAMLVDEGGSNDIPFGGGVMFSSPDISEKGYLDVKVEVSTSGGHSSVPPPHTGIGILSRLVTEIEDHPHESQLLRSGTPFASIQCTSTYGPTYPNDIRRLAKEALSDDAALKQLEEELLAASPLYSAMFGTTQAVDVIEGGVKVNALPERTSAIVNHRIAEHSSVAELQEHLVDVLSPTVRKFNMTLNAFGHIAIRGNEKAGVVTLSDAFNTALDPSPVTPLEYGPYSLLSGTIKATIGSSTFYNTTGVVIAPSLSLGNTDTRFYWNLTRHIFRYSPGAATDVYAGIHTINEARRAESVIEGIRFFTKLILNSDESLSL
ncbi:hypothetical protein SERLA73DRAFT_75491 [Serpula lacrymans var. lacrymans S7.3]|uniref:Peptidase M20 dimerisation domain-containing protein n=2 Tax=Serpula lacrymans var. lacrymans TaxID=341189 RepID=F8Q4X9_SERL3|nr:uncharacterized protein SERLADRAFT_440192 [Serpula lacrymans var. lacrymans S7.9]EGN96606.1 hypothetical protein SERLA73DRAFT_75491 [Serpula lacrymans var. lacrymans S7.3]EGO22175.1 hypothetical protein SERLADRAFT_440192 [Serpula lacrymans var. lacrymans S7.9]